MKILKWIIRIYTGYMLLFLFVIPFLFTDVQPGGITGAYILSGSMEPVIKTGSYVFYNRKQIIPEAGDVIMYRLSDMTVCHRVVKVTDDGYITKGDANESEDFAIVSKSQVIGIVIRLPWGCCIPEYGYVLDTLNTHRYLRIGLLAACIAGLII